MRYTFKPDDCMVITIPLGSIRNAREGQLMPEKFTCRFKDTYKVFQQGRPKALGMAQIITAVFIMCLGGILLNWHLGLGSHEIASVYICPSILYLVCGTLAISAGHTPIMPVMKASFIFNIIGLCVPAAVACVLVARDFSSGSLQESVFVGLNGVIVALYAFEFLLSAVLIYWEGEAVCRTHFNSLPMITLKQDM